MPASKQATDCGATSKWVKAADQAIEACPDDARAAIIALVANDFLERERALESTRVAVSSGFSRLAPPEIGIGSRITLQRSPRSV